MIVFTGFVLTNEKAAIRQEYNHSQNGRIPAEYVSVFMCSHFLPSDTILTDCTSKNAQHQSRDNLPVKVTQHQSTGGARHDGRAVASATGGIETQRETLATVSDGMTVRSGAVKSGIARRSSLQIGQAFPESRMETGVELECQKPCAAGKTTKANK